ncbi:hypothetical protein T4A_6277 [Trichinella pseudospiralis]|uniref:Uncharacterized protein n=1 Tax=Trichinella pseudospiralis TaxID=6337 RepID=A0A0V1DYF3_TRIPS|nr:hypothetical protein T4A_6277 [Trichinella pseudospiralis]
MHLKQAKQQSLTHLQYEDPQLVNGTARCTVGFDLISPSAIYFKYRLYSRHVCHFANSFMPDFISCIFLTMHHKKVLINKELLFCNVLDLH